MIRLKKRYAQRVACVVGALLVATYMTGCTAKRVKKETEEVIPVKVMRVEYKDLCTTIEYVGNIKAQDEAIVYPKVSGKIIEKLREDGSPVEKGDTIALIDRDETGLTFERAPVESPLRGIVGRVYVDLGTNVTPQTPIAFVVDMDKVKLYLNVPEKYVPKVSLGQEADITVDAYPDEKFIGHVTKISPVVDTDTRTVPLEITVDNTDHRLQSGMFADVDLVIEKRGHSLVVLKEALLGASPDFYLYVIEREKAFLRKVKAGIRQGPYVEVVEGLKEGDLVVVMGQQRLHDNAPVIAEVDKNL